MEYVVAEEAIGKGRGRSNDKGRHDIISLKPKNKPPHPSLFTSHRLKTTKNTTFKTQYKGNTNTNK